MDFGTGDYTNSTIDCKVWELNGSFGFTDNFHIAGSYQTADFDYIADAIEWNLGIGFNTPVSERLDVIAGISYVNLEIEPLPGQCHDCRVGISEDGYGLTVGLRSAISQRFEINAGVSYIDLSKSGGDTGLDGGVLFRLTNRMSIGLHGTWGGVASYQAAARWYFR